MIAHLSSVQLTRDILFTGLPMYPDTRDEIGSYIGRRGFLLQARALYLHSTPVFFLK